MYSVFDLISLQSRFYACHCLGFHGNTEVGYDWLDGALVAGDDHAPCSAHHFSHAPPDENRQGGVKVQHG